MDTVTSADAPEKQRRQPRPAPTVVVGLPALHLMAGQADRHAAPTQVIVVEPIAVREELAAAMTGIPAETLRAHRKNRTGPPFRKDGATVLYLTRELRAWAEALPAPALSA
jgi:threonine dehydrogenase-like Zn-dependent dehydrogenase